MVDINDLADRAAAAADLTDQARGRIDLDQEIGQSHAVVVTAVLETRTPLPTHILKDIRAGAAAWFSPTLRSMVLDAVNRQLSLR